MRLLLLLLLATFSCKENVVDLSKKPIKTYSFKQLPAEIKDILKNNIVQIDSTEIETFFSIPKNIKFKHERNINRNSWLEEVNSNYHYFQINDYHFRLRGNKGHPFIFYENNLYYTELNISIDDYQEKKFYRINLDSFLKQ